MVRKTLVQISENARAVLIIDEFDRLSQGVRRSFADVIKTLSDQAVRATVVLVGVADNVVDLIEGHESVSRAMVQIQMPRMNRREIRQIIDEGVSRLGMSIDDPAKARIVLLSQGLPHYAHLVGLNAARAAADSHSLAITMDSVNTAIEKAIVDAQQSIRQAYHEAIRSSRKENLFADVLLACALAPADELGFFAATDVRHSLHRITGKNYQIPTFAQHLNEFCLPKRSNIIKKEGQARLFRYRFSDPLMQPYVVMQGLASKRITEAQLGNTHD